MPDRMTVVSAGPRARAPRAPMPTQVAAAWDPDYISFDETFRHPVVHGNPPGVAAAPASPQAQLEQQVKLLEDELGGMGTMALRKRADLGEAEFMKAYSASDELRELFDAADADADADENGTLEAEEIAKFCEQLRPSKEMSAREVALAMAAMGAGDANLSRA